MKALIKRPTTVMSFLDTSRVSQSWRMGGAKDADAAHPKRWTCSP